MLTRCMDTALVNICGFVSETYQQIFVDEYAGMGVCSAALALAKDIAGRDFYSQKCSYLLHQVKRHLDYETAIIGRPGLVFFPLKIKVDFSTSFHVPHGKLIHHCFIPASFS
jgi:hypothetical protein